MKYTLKYKLLDDTLYFGEDGIENPVWGRII